jgi:hypothetical protein
MGERRGLPPSYPALFQKGRKHALTIDEKEGLEGIVV